MAEQFFVFNVTRRTRPLVPACVSVTLAKGHLAGGARFSLMSATSLTSRFYVGCCHLLSVCKYSFEHIFQKLLHVFSVSYHVVLTMAAESREARTGYPTKKCPGIRQSRSSMSSVTEIKGLEFRHASGMKSVLTK